ncbi:TonB-dependent siderophore receptor [filamentous cyanobacterium CCP4]|nr:TonB-dependent siderophore receptor [filamentous cyanobacterium CCP4]
MCIRDRSTPLPIHPSTPSPATTVDEWIAQIEASLTQIIEVRVEETEAGLQIVLETAEGELETPATQTMGNALIAEIPNAVLALPDGDSFEQFSPAEGIALVSVTNEPGDRVRVAITGTDAPPVAEVTATGLSVTLGEAVAGADDDAIQVVVTGEQDEGYNPSSATTATRTDTPLRNIPQSIQVVPRQVLEDRNVRTVNEAVETVSGVLDGSNNYGAPGGTNIIRGFISFDSGTLRNGLRDYNYYSVTPIGTIEQIEVLKGPASVLYGTQEPGGVINLITRRPLDEPYYNLEFEAGNYEFYQPTVDLSGPLTDDNSLLYRLIASYQSAGSYQDFVSSNTTTIAPSITWRIGDRTDLNLSYEYVRYFADNPNFEVPLLSDGSLPPQDFYPSYPDLALSEITTNRISTTLNHEFNENWQLRNNLTVVLNDRDLDRNVFNTVVNDQFLTDPFVESSSASANNYFGQIDLVGEFNTGSITHQLLAGFDINYFDERFEADVSTVPDLDIFDPDYDIPRPEFSSGFAFDDSVLNYGIYLQDQIVFTDNLQLLIGGRYDWITSELEILRDDSDQPVRGDGAFSPRIGLVYQPSDSVSLYASYNRSFKPTSGFSINPDGETFEPTRGTQYEIGGRVVFLEGKLSANLAAYHLTRTNILTPDPENPEFSIQTGEARSQGIELDVTGEILPGWNVILSYAYTDAEVTEDNVTPVGNQLDNVPFNQASLWTTYEIQEGDLQGLGFGLGLFYIGERQGDLANSFELPSYIRTDVALYFRRDRFNAAINVRNLFDIDYASYSFGRSFLQRGLPFTITGSIGWTF